MSCTHPCTIFLCGFNGTACRTVFVPGHADFLTYDAARKRLAETFPPFENGFVLEDGVVLTRNGFPVPCGKCDACKCAKAREWSLRCLMEYETAGSAVFVTLTYDDVHIPADRKVSKDDVQRFFKRFRKNLDIPVRYLVCGEYGGITHRPHYHAILFGVSLDDLHVKVQGSARSGNLQFESDLLSKSWQNGFAVVSDFSAETASYVARYNVKSVVSDEGFLLMSRRPGLGVEWLKKHDLNVDDSVYFKGKSYFLPRYFKTLLLDGISYDDRLNRLQVADEFSTMKDRLLAIQHGVTSYSELEELKTKLFKIHFKNLPGRVL